MKKAALSLLLLTGINLPISYGQTTGKMKVIVSVDWEGENLDSKNLRAMEQFRNDFPDVPLLHFINAAYYTKPTANSTQVSQKIRSVLKSEDEVGLHLHGWKRLFEASGVRFRSEPSFNNLGNCSYDCGHGVAISAYSERELTRVIQHSIDILREQDFPQPHSFRAGGWLATENVRQALLRTGFTRDNSSVPPRFIKIFPSLHAYVEPLWRQVHETSQPWTISSLNGQDLLEVPDNGCLADYVSPQEMLAVFKKNETLWREDPTQNVVVSIGFHQETATDYIARVAAAIRLIRDYSLNKNIPLEFTTTALLD